RARAGMLVRTRAFFCQRGVLEVETPLLQQGPNRDHGITPVPVTLADGRRWLITSPEHHLKRLLAAGWPDCWTLATCLRDGECGRRHQPEFRLLEWYRLGYDEHCLATETCACIQALLGRDAPVQRISYREAFRAHCGIDPFQADLGALQRAAGPELCTAAGDRRGDLLDLLLSQTVETSFDPDALTVLTDWPPEQAAQARCRNDAAGTPVAARFEIFHGGLELANGYHECNDAQELRRRFTADAGRRPTDDGDHDEHFLAALAHGLPACAGVAVGFDRLLMLLLERPDIASVRSFAWPQA
ncbi:MAG: EF-P lysine aminoacylase EpmA, partial [Planctomycetota bacterium]